MKKKQTFGFLLLCTALALTIIFSTKLPHIRAEKLFEKSVEAPPEGEPYSFYNVTFKSSELPNQIRVVVEPYYMIDFWVVNDTGLASLEGCMIFGEAFKPWYPDKGPFYGIVAYIREVNITTVRTFDFSNINAGITYCFVVLNFYDINQDVYVSIDKVYLESPRPLLNPDLPVLVFTIFIFFAGMFFILIGGKRKPRKTRKSVVKYVKWFIPLEVCSIILKKLSANNYFN